MWCRSPTPPRRWRSCSTRCSPIRSTSSCPPARNTRLGSVLRIGLTGGIGAGKSTVARELERLGAVVIDAYVLSREVVAPGTEGLAAVVEEFGETVLTANGALDRPALGRIVFADRAARRRLEEITHPRIAAETARRPAERPPGTAVGHARPLLLANHP